MNPLQIRKPLRHQAGLTLVELLITLAVSAVALGAAVPGFNQLRERHQIEGAAAQLETDIQHARSLAVARGASVRMSFETTADASCYVVHTGNAGDCRCTARGDAVCRGNAQAMQTVRWGAETSVQVAANAPSILFDATRGTVTPTATIRVQGRNAAIQQVVNIMGRVRSCSPAPALPGYRAC
ncbi:MAG: GspH/FimT family pseudopilin [Rubrivivax sp.]|nr:GspH/FimT family pseudopilin [Rubrivivax sp.]